ARKKKLRVLPGPRHRFHEVPRILERPRGRSVELGDAATVRREGGCQAQAHAAIWGKKVS
ncbi:hypothetical protein, partial [Limnobacter sp.]|uniref:hypothetical protein n=1 Tax=Limnobacter sp. TaxID=2003368 RepID=UPI00311F1544